MYTEPISIFYNINSHPFPGYHSRHIFSWTITVKTVCSTYIIYMLLYKRHYLKLVLKASITHTVTGQNPPGQNPPGQNPPGQYHPGQNPPKPKSPRTKSPRTKSPRTKSPQDKIPPGQNPPRAIQNPINSLQNSSRPPLILYKNLSARPPLILYKNLSARFPPVLSPVDGPGTPTGTPTDTRYTDRSLTSP